MPFFSHNPQKKAGTVKDSAGCAKCDYGPWGLLNRTTEVRYCKRSGCGSQETRGHSCARNGCQLHPDNNIPGT